MRSTVTLIIVAILFGAPLILAPPTAAAQTNQRCFAETSQCIAGAIRGYWERNGGLPVFGYPISAEHEELTEGRSIRVQWFERDRLEIQADGSITAGRLGARVLELQGRPWVFNEGGAAEPGCRLAPQTGYAICGVFRDFWERNGGVERFGYPITGVLEEQIEGRIYRVQYFERRRMEEHPELAGTAYEVQLGLLGSATASASVCAPAPTETLQRAVRCYLDRMGCPSDQGRAGAIAWQRYERGVMYWIAASSSAPPMIFVIVNDDAAQRSTWLARTDTYGEGEPVGGPVPPGRIAPQRGFGKLWWGDGAISAALGWPLEPEHGGSGAAVPFTSGGWMLERQLPGLVVVMQPGGTAFGVTPDLLPD